MKMSLNCIRKTCLVLACFSFTFLFTGCWDRLELEEQAFVIAIGVDLAPDNMLFVTYQFASPAGGGLQGVSGSSTNMPSSEIVTFPASDIISARDLASESVTRRPSFAHARNIIVSEELAKSDMLFKILSAAVRDRQIRRDSYIIISKEKASDFIRGNDPKLESRPHKFYEFMSRRWQETGLVPFSDVHRYVQRVLQGQDLFLVNYGTTIETQTKVSNSDDKHYPGDIDKGKENTSENSGSDSKEGKGGNPVEVIGSAVMKDGKMVGSLDGRETRFCLILRPHFPVNSIQMSFPDPLENKYRVATQLSKEAINFDMYLQENPPRIDVHVKTQIIVLAISSGIDYVENLTNQELLRNSIQKDLEKDSKELIKKTKEEYGEDPFQWSFEVRKKFWTLDDYEKFDWKTKYPKANINVNFNVQIRGFGKQLIPPGAERGEQ